MKLQRCPKTYLYDTHRSQNPEETLRRVREVAKHIGVSKVVDITHLDRVGIPVVSCHRPTAAKGAVTVHTGKGATKTQAEVSALMEAIERYSAEFHEEDKGKIVKGSYSQLKSKLNLLNPEELILPAGLKWSPDTVLRWVKGWNLLNDEEIHVPVSAVYHPYTPEDDLHLFKTTTNGLASGNTLEEAVLHGLMEVIERDAWSTVEALRETCPDLHIDHCQTPLPRQLLEKFERAGIKITLKALPTEVGIPVVGAIADDQLSKDPALLVMGFGAHLNPEIAVIRALTEVAQSRLTQIYGAREDTKRAEFLRLLGYERVKRLNKHWFSSSGEGVDISQLPRLDTPDILDDIHVTLQKLRKAGVSKAIAVNLTREETGISTVRIIIPGMEVYGLDSTRIGAKIQSKLADRPSIPRAPLK